MPLERLLVFDKKFNVFMDVSGSDSSPTQPKQDHDNPKPAIPLLKSAKTSVFTVLSTATDTTKLADTIQHLSLAISQSTPADSADPRLVIGACYSMRSTLQRMMPDRSIVDGFSWDTDKWRLLYHQSATGWKFVAIVSAGKGGADHRQLVAFYEQIFVPGVINSPLYYRQVNGKERIVVSDGLASTTRLFFAAAS